MSLAIMGCNRPPIASCLRSLTKYCTNKQITSDSKFDLLPLICLDIKNMHNAPKT
jgi:hypothetical protein